MTTSAIAAQATALTPAPVIHAPSTHQCVAPRCRKMVAPDRAMCRYHWKQVTPENRDRVLAAFVPGQTAQTASDEYLQALAAAVQDITTKRIKNLHPCFIPGCRRHVPETAVVCHECWKVLPERNQRAITGLRTAPGCEADPIRVDRVISAAADIVHNAPGNRGRFR